MFRSSSPPPRVASPTPRQRLMSFLGGVTSPGLASSRSGNTGSRSPERPPSPVPVVSQLQLHAASTEPTAESAFSNAPSHINSQTDPAASPSPQKTASHEREVQRKPSRTLTRRLSNSSATGSGPFAPATLFRRKSSSQGVYGSGMGISSKDFPPVSSDFEGIATSEAQLLDESSLSQSNDFAKHTGSSRPVSPARGLYGAAADPASDSISSPPGSPTKRARAIFFGGGRSRKDSTASVVSAGISGGASNTVSRPSSPVKELRVGSPSKGFSSPGGAAKRVIDKSMIGLPTNFKHTSGGGTSSPALNTAISLPGLASPSSGRDRKTSLPSSSPQRHHHYHQMSSSSSSQGAGAEAATDSLNDSLAHINLALNGDASQSDSPSSWQPRDTRLDTVKEVPSGFIQRFEKAGQVPLAAAPAPGEGLGRGGSRADARLLFGGISGLPRSEMDDLSYSSTGLPTGHDRISASPLRASSPPLAAGRPWPARPSSPLAAKSAFTELGLTGDILPPQSPGAGSAASSRPSSPRKGRRKPVPQLDSFDDTSVSREPEAISPASPTAAAVLGSTPSTLSHRLPPTSPASQPRAVQQDWASTLAEISEALNSPLANASPAFQTSPASPSIVEQGQRRTAILLGGAAPTREAQSRWDEEKLNVKGT